jgi:hypothetical protein
MPGRILSMLGPGGRDRLVSLHRTISAATLVMPLAAAVALCLHAASLPAPRPMQDAPGPRFGLERSVRDRLWERFANEEDSMRRLARERFPEHAWSQEDDYFSNVRDLVHVLAAGAGVHYSRVYMVYDEGVKLRRTTRKGRPLPAFTRPLDPRRE